MNKKSNRRKNKGVSESKKISIQSIEVVKGETRTENLSSLRYSIKPENYGRVIDELSKFPYNFTNLLSGNVKKTTSELDGHNLLFLDFDAEFSWAKNIIQKNGTAINCFLELASKYSAAIASMEYQEAAKMLSQIEIDHGQSVWLIKNRIAFLQLTEGLESQKKYVQSIKNELKDGSLIRFITHWVSVRNEPQASAVRFYTQVGNIINALNSTRQLGFQEYLKYHILASDTLDVTAAIQILRIEYSRSLVDYYEAFVCLVRTMAVAENDKFAQKITNLLSGDKFRISDPRLEIVQSLFNDEDAPSRCWSNAVESYDLLLEGKYEIAYHSALGLLKADPSDPIPLMIAAYAKSCGFFPSTEILEGETEGLKNLLLPTISKLSKIINKGPLAASKELNELNKLALNFANFPWAQIVNFIVAMEMEAFPVVEDVDVVSTFKIPFFHPILLEFIPQENLFERYQAKCFRMYGESLTANYITSIRNGDITFEDDHLSDLSEALRSGLIKYKKGNFKDAIEHASRLKNSNLGYFVRRANSIITFSYLENNNLKMACKETAECYLNDRDQHPFLPLLQLYSRIKPGTVEWESVNKAIDFPIVLDACTKHVDSEAETPRRFAYEDFLTENGYGKPSELYSIISTLDKAKIIYYLKYICIETNMDTSSAFEGGSNEVVAERLSVCRILAEIDTANKDQYAEEINDLVRRQVITSRKLEVDKSRIYVDIQSVKEWAHKEILENFNRYIEYKKLNLNETDSSHKKGHHVNTESSVLSTISVPENESNALLRFMVEEIANTYLSVDFGLDRFLSTRIRHGILEGHLRRPIETHHLITKKQHKSGPYLPNTYWFGKLSGYESKFIKDYDRAFSKFSEAYDGLISKMLNDWLQVKKANKPNGLFDFAIAEKDIHSIADYVTPATTIKEFVDYVINMLEHALVLNLFNIREVIYVEVKKEAKNIINKFQESTGKISSTISSELSSCIHQARTDMQNQFEKIVEWFVPSATGDSTPFRIEDAMAVAEEMIKETNSSFAINFTQESISDDSFEIHGSLPRFVDIFVNIFENIVKRSGLAKPVANVTIRIDETLENLFFIFIRIENEIDKSIDCEPIILELKRKKSLLSNGSYKEYLAAEKNSGLFKIHKSVMECNAIGYDSYKPTMDFGIENGRFEIEMSIPFRVFTLNPEEQ